jgi:hypothetical protein
MRARPPQGRARQSMPAAPSVRHNISGEPQCPRPPPLRPPSRSPSAPCGVIGTISTGPHIVRRDVQPQHTNILAGNIDSSAEILRPEDIRRRDDPFRKHSDQARPYPARQAALSSVSSQTPDQRTKSHTPNTPDSAAGYPPEGRPSFFFSLSGPDGSGPKNQTTNPKQKNQTLSAAGKPAALCRGREKTRTTKQSGDHPHCIRRNRRACAHQSRGARCSRATPRSRVHPRHGAPHAPQGHEGRGPTARLSPKTRISGLFRAGRTGAE